MAEGPCAAKNVPSYSLLGILHSTYRVPNPTSEKGDAISYKTGLTITYLCFIAHLLSELNVRKLVVVPQAPE